MTLRELLKERGIAYKVVSDALGVHSNNMPRYDDLMKRSVEEVLIISKATGISPSELIGISLPVISLPQSTPINPERLFSMIESQQRTIESQQATIGSMQEISKKMLAQAGNVATCASASGFELGK